MSYDYPYTFAYNGKLSLIIFTGQQCRVVSQGLRGNVRIEFKNGYQIDAKSRWLKKRQRRFGRK